MAIERTENVRLQYFSTQLKCNVTSVNPQSILKIYLESEHLQELWIDLVSKNPQIVRGHIFAEKQLRLLLHTQRSHGPKHFKTLPGNKSAIKK